GLPIGRKTGLGGHAVEGFGENLSVATGSGRDSDVPGAVVEKLQVSRSGVCEPLAVGRPGGVIFLPGKIADLRGMGALIGIVGGDQPNVGVGGAVGGRLGAVAGEGGRLAVRRPGRVGGIVIARDYLP